MEKLLRFAKKPQKLRKFSPVKLSLFTVHFHKADFIHEICKKFIRWLNTHKMDIYTPLHIARTYIFIISNIEIRNIYNYMHAMSVHMFNCTSCLLHNTYIPLMVKILKKQQNRAHPKEKCLMLHNLKHLNHAQNKTVFCCVTCSSYKLILSCTQKPFIMLPWQ